MSFLRVRLNIIFISVYSIPDWAAEKLNEIEKLSYFESRAHIGTRKMSRYKAGYLIKEIFERFTNRTKGPFMPDRRFFLYSGHDITIANALNALDVTRVSPNSLTHHIIIDTSN